MIKRFNRFELKYIIDGSVRDHLVDEVGARLWPDSEGDAIGSYVVASQYFDTPDLKFFRAKIDGLRYRRKVRIRQYGMPPSTSDPTVMVEIKQRIGRTTQKRRLALPLGAAHALCTGGGVPSFVGDGDRAVAEEVDYLARSLGLEPVCVTVYRRRAFLGGVCEPGLRITFDEELTCTPPAWHILEGTPRLRVLSPDSVILEVKANDKVPDWVVNLLARHSCPVRRFSKYCNAVRVLHDRHSSAMAG